MPEEIQGVKRLMDLRHLVGPAGSALTVQSLPSLVPQSGQSTILRYPYLVLPKAGGSLSLLVKSVVYSSGLPCRRHICPTYGWRRFFF